MSVEDTEVVLPRSPHDPIVLMVIGLGLGFVGGIVSLTDAAPLGFFVAAAGGLVVFIGAVGQGVLMGLRVARYEQYLQDLIDEAGPE